MIVFTFLAALASLVPSLFTLAAALFTAILVPLATAIILGILELTTAVVASTESVLLLIFSPPILLFPLKLVRAVGTPIVEGGSVVLAPVVYPLQALSICVAGALALVLEFKVSGRLHSCVGPRGPARLGVCRVPLIGCIHH